MFNITKTYQRYQLKRLRLKLREDLRALEEEYRNNNTWSASLNINCQILTLINPRLLTIHTSDYVGLRVNTGFSNVVHLFNWCKVVNTALRNRELITHDITDIMYRRKSKTLSDFLLTSEMKRYPVDALHRNLLTELSTMCHLFDDIKNPQYADRCSAALNPIWVDVFAVVEMLCTIGAQDEQ